MFGYFNQPDINQGVQEYGKCCGAVLMDVRSPQEYGCGHIPGSINIPLQTLDKAASEVENTDTPLYVYCHSGARSHQAAARLRQMGYTNVRNIGGIAAYTGRMEG